MVVPRPLCPLAAAFFLALAAMSEPSSAPERHGARPARRIFPAAQPRRVLSSRCLHWSFPPPQVLVRAR